MAESPPMKPPIGGIGKVAPGVKPQVKPVLTQGVKPSGTPVQVKTPGSESGANPNMAGSVKNIATRAPLFRIEPMEEAERYLKFMVYGEYGSGKTLLAASSVQVPAMRDVLLISAESGDRTLKDSDEDAFDEIDTIKCHNFKQVSAIVDYLRTHCRLRDANDIEGLRAQEEQYRGEARDEPRKYQTVIIDSISEVEQYALYHLLGVTERTSIIEDVASAEFKEYKQLNIAMKRMLRSFRDLPMHVMFICAQGYVQDENKRKTYAPQLTGKLSSQVQGFMDLVGFITVMEKQKDGTTPRRMFIQPDPRGRYEAKNRFPAYREAYIEIPDISTGTPGMEAILRAVGLWGDLQKAAKAKEKAAAAAK